MRDTPACPSHRRSSARCCVRPPNVARNGLEEGTGVRLHPRPQRMLRLRPRDAVALTEVRASRIQAVIPVVASADGGTFQGVPVGRWAQHLLTQSGGGGHSGQDVDRQLGADPLAVQDVSGIEQIPRTVDVEERVWIDGEQLLWGQIDTGVHEQTVRGVGMSDAKVMPRIAEALGVAPTDLGRVLILGIPGPHLSDQLLPDAGEGVTTSTQPTATPGGSAGPVPVSETTDTTLSATSGRPGRLKRTSPVFWVVMVFAHPGFRRPLVWMLITAFKSSVEARSVPPTLVPQEPTVSALRAALCHRGCRQQRHQGLSHFSRRSS